jgi:hypothetical protein
MKLRYLILLLLVAVPAKATTVATGKSNYAVATHTDCVPNGGGVTSGNYEVIGVQVSSSNAASIASTRVPTWTQAYAIVDSISYYYWYGPATSSGAETITVTLASGTGLIGSGCGEWTSHFNVKSAGSYFAMFPLVAKITVATNSDIVVWASSNLGNPLISAPFTTEQSIMNGGTTFTVLSDYVAPSAGTYTIATNGAASPVFVVAFCSGSCVTSSPSSQIVRRNGNEKNLNKRRVVAVSQRAR